MLEAVRVSAALTPGIPSVTSDSKLGIVALIADDTGSDPVAVIGDGSAGKTRAASLCPIAPRRAGSTESGSVIAESLLHVSYRSNFTGPDAGDLRQIVRYGRPLE